MSLVQQPTIGMVVNTSPKPPLLISEMGTPVFTGIHSFTLELNLSDSRTNSRVNLGYTVDRGAQVELKWERV